MKLEFWTLTLFSAAALAACGGESDPGDANAGGGGGVGYWTTTTATGGAGGGATGGAGGTGGAATGGAGGGTGGAATGGAGGGTGGAATGGAGGGTGGASTSTTTSMSSTTSSTTTSTTSTSTTTTSTTSTSTNPVSCSSEPDWDTCSDCCANQEDDAWAEFVSWIYGSCGCQTGSPCYNVCGQGLMCSDPNYTIPDACHTCMAAPATQADSCFDDAVSACLGEAECKPVLTCFQTCPD